MLDRFGREINYLRIAVIDRCNLRCVYCLPENGIKLRSHQEILSFEEILAIVKRASKMGINKIRLTGGEPLLRRDIVVLVKMLAQLEGIKDLALTTNGILLANYAQDLKAAGLHRVNVSLDTTDPKYFYKNTRGGDITQVLAGIDAALRVGLVPLKLNCVVDNLNENQHALLVKEFAQAKNLEVRFIQKMDFVTGKFATVIAKGGGDCKNCNRLRLLSDGKILPCLFSDVTFDTRTLGIDHALEQALLHKPERGAPCKPRWMGEIGG